MATMDTFVYCAESISPFREIGRDRDYYTELDQALRSRWDSTMDKGIFRYDLTDMTTRVIPGRFGFVAQKNPRRFSHRRRPMDTRSLRQPFDGAQFNFNKISTQEVLFKIRRIPSVADVLTEEKEEDEEEHVIVVNVSPIDYGHVLLVPTPKKNLPQVMTMESLVLCLEIVALCGHSALCMVANSLLAYASVNHLHYHFMYLDYELPVTKVTGNHLAGGCYELVHHAVPGFGFQFDTTSIACAQDIPHNVVMYRGAPFDACSNKPVIRTIVIPRKPAYGIKHLYEEGKDPEPFCAAACELGLGFIPVLDQIKYPNITEDEVLAILRQMAFTSEEFEPLRLHIKSLF